MKRSEWIKDAKENDDPHSFFTVPAWELKRLIDNLDKAVDVIRYYRHTLEYLKDHTVIVDGKQADISDNHDIRDQAINFLKEYEK